MTSPIRTLIVDDEPPARARLRRLLGGETDVDLIAEASDGEAAICAIAEHKPDLLFLDVNMPPPNGLDVLRTARDAWLPQTIFTTAYAEHAVTAFELEAVDYLLKPYSIERFGQAMERVRERLRARGEGAPVEGDAEITPFPRATSPVECFLVKNNDSYAVVRAGDIAWAEAAGNYVILHTPTGRHLLRRTVQALEAELDPARFFRSSRSSIVNLSRIDRIEHIAADDFVLQLRDGAKVPLTRSLRELKERLGTP